MTTKEVLDHHLETFTEQDLDGVMEDYAEDARLISQTGTYHGHDEIADLFENLFAEFSKPGTSFTLNRKVVEGDYAYIVWEAETPDSVYEFATDTFVVRDGEIVAQTFAGDVTPKE